jgi:hypothetical protein
LATTRRGFEVGLAAAEFGQALGTLSFNKSFQALVQQGGTVEGSGQLASFGQQGFIECNCGSHGMAPNIGINYIII